jgi:signal transduction histidine kinase
MAAHILAFQRTWRRWLAGVRIVLGAACFVLQLTPVVQSGPVVLTGAFTAYALFALVRSRKPGTPGLLYLFADAVFFLAFSTYGADPGSWLSSALYCYLLVSAVIVHDWADVFIVVGVCIAFFGLLHSLEAELLRRLVLFSGVLACALAYQKRKLRERLEAASRSERLLREEAARASDAERQRIAADFHDGPLQEVISLQIRLEVLKRLLERDRADGMNELAQVQELSKTLVGELRSFLRTMRPLPVAGTDLVASLRRVLEEFQKDTGIAVRFASEGPVTAAPETCLEIAQILREALHNVQKHARADRVAVSLEKNGKNVELAVDDDGTGFAFSGTFTLDELELLRLGPQSIERRVRGLGGELVIESRPGHGAGLKIRVPA